MLEQTCAPLRVERLQREILVVPVKKEPTRINYLKAERSSGALPQRGTASRNGAAEYLWLPSRSDHSPKYGKTADPSATEPVDTSAGYNIRSAIAELEKRRARLFALAHAAEARAQEAEEKCELAKNKLERETNHRLVAEATARVAKEKAHKIEALVIGAEAGDHKAAERNLVFGLLVFANSGEEADAREAKSPARSQIETRRKARLETGDTSAAIELTPWREGAFTSSNLLKSVGDYHKSRVTEQEGPGIKRKFITYGTVVMLLVGACWMLKTAFN